MQINNQNVSNVENLVENLKKQLKDYIVNKEKDIEKQRFNVQRENLREVFVFYGQVKLPGKSSTFEEIKENQSVLTIQKFLQFCMDFNIIGIPTQQCRFISQDEVKIMFKRVSMSSRIMKESHFFVKSM